MTQDKNLLLSEPLEQTSLSEFSEPVVFKEYRLGQYTVVVRLTTDGLFAGIQQIREEADFLNLEQRMRIPSLDVDKYYRDDDGA